MESSQFSPVYGCRDELAHDLKATQQAAQRADEDAAFAIDYTYTAIEEAEYAVLDPDLAHMDAHELEKKGVKDTSEYTESTAQEPPT